MNIAVLIGISEYASAGDLPACRSDVQQMGRLLAATGKYSDICSVTLDTSAEKVKDALRDFFAQYRDKQPVEEAFFYFSGHGTYQSDLLLCCSDFDPQRPASTSVSNAELDDLLRSVAPGVGVKVLDACQSGSPYIKDPSFSFEKALRESRLSSFICMASSRQDQSSYATPESSVFTERFVTAALSKTEGSVLYRDIQSSLADAFVAMPDQTPYFILQGSGLEVFSRVTPEMKAMAKARTSLQAVALTETSLESAVEREIRRLDALYVSKEAASSAIQRAGASLERAQLNNALVRAFYTLETTAGEKLATLDGIRKVATFAREQGWERRYFVRVVEEEYQVLVAADPLAEALGVLTRRRPNDYIKETRRRPASLEATQALSLEAGKIVFKSKDHPSLKGFALFLGFVHSLTELVVVSAIAQLVQKGWDEQALDLSQLEWRVTTHLWKDVVDHPEIVWEQPLRSAEEHVQQYLETLVPKVEEKSQAPSQGADTRAGQRGPIPGSP